MAVEAAEPAEVNGWLLILFIGIFQCRGRVCDGEGGLRAYLASDGRAAIVTVGHRVWGHVECELAETELSDPVRLCGYASP